MRVVSGLTKSRTRRSETWNERQRGDSDGLALERQKVEIELSEEQNGGAEEEGKRKHDRTPRTRRMRY